MLLFVVVFFYTIQILPCTFSLESNEVDCVSHCIGTEIFWTIQIILGERICVLIAHVCVYVYCVRISVVHFFFYSPRGQKYVLFFLYRIRSANVKLFHCNFWFEIHLLLEFSFVVDCIFEIFYSFFEIFFSFVSVAGIVGSMHRHHLSTLYLIFWLRYAGEFSRIFRFTSVSLIETTCRWLHFKSNLMPAAFEYLMSSFFSIFLTQFCYVQSFVFI